MKTLYCIHELCYVDFEYDLIDRGGEGDIFHLNLNFQQAFDQPPVVMVSASNNYYEIGKLIYGIKIIKKYIYRVRNLNSPHI